MTSIDYPAIEQVRGNLSGAPVLRHSRILAPDLLLNVDQAAEWLAEAHQRKLSQVEIILPFYREHQGQLADPL